MANQGAKKRKEENSRHMKNLLRLIIACNVIYLVVRAGIFHSTFKWKQWVGFMLTFFAYIIPYQQLATMANPAYTDDGELLDGGFDMSTGGICGAVLVKAPSFFERKQKMNSYPFAFQIPAFAAYKLIGLLKGFLPHGSEEGEEDEKTRKKREKMEKRASRPKFAKTRTR
ncbi:hypothetical protein RHGRI_009211 [Rhododendron griersonianum]|uniref:Transmembrane protein n=1 Tax=Rhododendron griersonianum TaxID=479676 RepID=A0AAV6L3G8_9ERIC|nr:hypothetical protein RHGRI_009211 [Rhododendron griersonianum]